jgi:hypothetical protein
MSCVKNDTVDRSYPNSESSSHGDTKLNVSTRCAAGLQASVPSYETSYYNAVNRILISLRGNLHISKSG